MILCYLELVGLWWRIWLDFQCPHRKLYVYIYIIYFVRVWGGGLLYIFRSIHIFYLCISWVSVFLDGGSHCSYRCGPSSMWRWDSPSSCFFYTTTSSSPKFLSILDPYPDQGFLPPQRYGPAHPHQGDGLKDHHGSYAVLD